MDVVISPEILGVIAGISTIATGITKVVMKRTPEWFAKKHWGLIISIVCCAIASLAWEAIYPGASWLWIATRSAMALGGSNLLHSGVKTATAIKAGNGGGNG